MLACHQLGEVLRVPHWLIDPLPDSIGFDVAAKVHDLANSLRALKCADLAMGTTVVVTAATGAMGTATAKLAKHFGIAHAVIDFIPDGPATGQAMAAGGPAVWSDEAETRFKRDQVWNPAQLHPGWAYLIRKA